MQDPNQQILMYRMLNDGNRSPIDEAPTVNFLNPDSGEIFSIDMPDSFICWHDNTHAVFVHDSHEAEGPPYLSVLNLSDGSLIRYTENDPSFGTYYFYTWMCDPHTHQNPPQPAYDVKIDDSTGGEESAYIIDNKTGQSERLTDPNDSIQDVGGFITSDKKFIIVIQVNEKSTYSADGFSNQVSIYDFLNRKIIKTIQDTIWSLRYISASNDLIYSQGRRSICKVNIFLEPKICVENKDGIYNIEDFSATNSNYLIILQTADANTTEHIGDQIAIYKITSMKLFMTINDSDINDLRLFGDSSNFMYMRGKATPCIVDIQSGTKKCVHAIPDRYPGQSMLITRVPPETKYLQFLHWGGDPVTGGLCFYDLVSGVFNCPTDGLSVLEKNVLTDYEISPDQNYISFNYEFNTCPNCDFAGSDPGVAVIGFDGSHFIDLGPSNSPGFGGLDLVSTWRPLPSAQLNP